MTREEAAICCRIISQDVHDLADVIRNIEDHRDELKALIVQLTDLHTQKESAP